MIESEIGNHYAELPPDVDPCSFAAVQNGVILDVFDTYQEAVDCCKNEIKRDFLSLVIRKKLRKFLKNNSNVSLHQYHVLTIINSEEVIE